ncbi:TRAM domain-containing protein [Methanosarcinaceae archaeon]|nr:TRAM domain-containing protein [Methanosarcinaceae archaeon]MBQ3620681.1 TRAM domain-containing protein [Methanosarcinaceae archaeon]
MFSSKKPIFNNNNANEVKAPVSEGKTYTVKIENIAEKGDGIARIEGYVIFVPDTAAGEEVTVRIQRVLPKYAFACVVDE